MDNEQLKKEQKSIGVNELYDHIIQFMTPEEALRKLLSSSLIEYDKLKFSSPEVAVHPLIIIAVAATDLGWDIAIEGTEKCKDVRGLVIGIPEYIDTIFPKKGE